MEDETILELADVTLRVRDRKLLPHTSFTIRRGEQWAVLGPNGSGKSTLARTIAGILPTASGHLRLRGDERVRLVSFEVQAELYGRELELDQARRFSGRTNEVLTPRTLLDESGDPHGTNPETGFGHPLEIEHLLDRPFRHLSAGEMRKILIARALKEHPSLLVLDEPFDGLDRSSRTSLSSYLEGLIEEGRHLILTTHRGDELLDGITHVLMLRDGEVIGSGPREEMLTRELVEELYGFDAVTHAGSFVRESSKHSNAAFLEDRRTREGTPSAGGAAPHANEPGETIVAFDQVNVQYEGVSILRDLSFRVARGERWGIFGPNGSGKTTILNLIVGENLQGYANRIELFGRRKGGGESIWEIRRHIGVVTPHLQLGYRRSVSGLEVVLSGLFDSIGLYRRPNEEETARAQAALTRLGIQALADRFFNRLSNGQRRLLLIARAMIKDPDLLILDEPCQGLDPPNRRRVLRAIDSACEGQRTALLYVTHHDDEHPRALTHVLRLHGPGEAATVELLR